MMGGHAILKPGVVPHIFHCQPSRTSVHSCQPRKGVEVQHEAIDSSELQQIPSEPTNSSPQDLKMIRQEDPCMEEAYAKMEPQIEIDVSPIKLIGLSGPSHCKGKWDFSEVYSDSD